MYTYTRVEPTEPMYTLLICRCVGANRLRLNSHRRACPWRKPFLSAATDEEVKQLFQDREAIRPMFPEFWVNGEGGWDWTSTKKGNAFVSS